MSGSRSASQGKRPNLGVLRAAPFAPLSGLLGAAGVDAEALLAEFGLGVEFLADPENVIPFSVAGKLMSRAVAATGQPLLGLRLGMGCGLATLGTVGYLMRSSPDVATALRMLVDHLHIHDGGAVVSLDLEEGLAGLCYHIVSPGVESADQIADAALAIGHNVMSELCGPDWRARAVTLAHPRPPDTSEHRRFFGVTPVFDAERNTIGFDPACLAQPLASADPVLHRLMATRAAEAASARAVDVVDALRRLLRPMVSSPDCDLATVAARMGMPGRTLNRRLAAEGTSFRALREEVRLDVACQLLRHTQRPAFEIAGLLGYSEASAFTRAFRRRIGVAPAVWRRSAAMAAPA